jgi:hypothetical protein
MANEERYRAPIYFDGIGPFPMSAWDESGYIMEWTSYKFPHRRYQASEGLSVSSLNVTGQIYFLNGIDGYEDLWPITFMQMRRRLQLSRQGKLKLPVLGEINGHFTKWDVQYSVDTLNGCTVNFAFVQDMEEGLTQNDIVERNPLAGAKANAAILDGAVAKLAAAPPKRFDVINGDLAVDVFMRVQQVDALLASPPPAPPSLPSFPSRGMLGVLQKTPPFVELVQEFDSWLQSEEATFDQIRAETDRIKLRFDDLLATQEMLFSDNADVMVAAVGAKAQIEEAGQDAQAKSARLISAVFDRAMSAAEIAHALYGDASRAEEIMKYNPTMRDEYPSSTRINFLDR